MLCSCLGVGKSGIVAGEDPALWMMSGYWDYVVCVLARTEQAVDDGGGACEHAPYELLVTQADNIRSYWSEK